MSVNIITSATLDQLIAALCNTLLYSLLQGVLLATIAGLVVLTTRKVTAATRYNLLTGLMLLFVCTSAFTFITQLNNIPKATPAPVHDDFTMPKNSVGVTADDGIFAQNSPVVVSPATQTLQISRPDFRIRVISFINNNHQIIVLIWFVVICVRSIQLGLGLRGVYRLKYTGVREVSAEWKNRLAGMARQLGINRSIALLESGLARVPMVVGYLRPVILMPIGLITALSMGEVDAILLHELAHIRRRDYMVNLLQSLVEVVYFFNPAVLWVSSLIKTERENCCDDIAFARSQSKSGYLRALLVCEEYQQNVPAYAMAFPGQKIKLVERVNRLIKNKNHSLNVVEKTLLTLCLIISGICISAFAKKDDVKKVKNAIASVAKPLSKVADVILGEQPIVTQDRSVSQQTNHSAPDTTANLTPAPENILVSADTIKKSGYIVDAKQVLKMDSVYKAIGTDKESMVLIEPSPASAATKLINASMITDGFMTKDNPVSFAFQDSTFYVDAKPQSAEVSKKYYSIWKHFDGGRQPKFEGPVIGAGRMYMYNHIVAQLLRDGIVKDGDKLSYRLNNNGFVVNGVKQSPDIYKKYFDECIKPMPVSSMDWTINDEGFSNILSSRNTRSPAKSVTQNDPALKTSSTTAKSALYLDSLFKAKGYNDDKHMRYKPVLDTTKSWLSIEGTKVWLRAMKADGLIPTKFSYNAADSSFMVNGKRLPPEQEKKYLPIVKPYLERYPPDMPRYIYDGHNPIVKERNQYLSTRLKAMLFKDGLVKDNEKYTLTLNNKEFILNGVQQSPAVYKRYFDELIKPLPYVSVTYYAGSMTYSPYR